MQLIGFCIPCIFLVTTAYNKHDIHSDSRLTDVTSTHQFHVRKVIQPFNDSAMRILPFDLYTQHFYYPLSVNIMEGIKQNVRENANFFFFSKNGIFLWAVCSFRFSPDLPDLHLLNTCILKRVLDTRLTVSALGFNRDLV